MRSFLVWATFAVFLMPTDARAEDWRVASAVTKHDHATIVWLVDAETIQQSGNQVRFWMDMRTKLVDETGSNRVLQLVEADCNDRSYAGLQTETYFAGTPLKDIGPMGRSFAAPGTVIYGIIGHVCGGDYSQPISPKNNPDEVTRMLFGEQWFKKPGHRNGKSAARSKPRVKAWTLDKVA